jgi:hypothetical protein
MRRIGYERMSHPNTRYGDDCDDDWKMLELIPCVHSSRNLGGGSSRGGDAALPALFPCMLAHLHNIPVELLNELGENRERDGRESFAGGPRPTSWKRCDMRDRIPRASVCAGARPQHSLRSLSTRNDMSGALQADPKWRKYSQLVEKTLQSFDQVNEWADFITFLAKLLKARRVFPAQNRRS